MTYFIKTFGCASNTADSERIAASFANRGYKLAKNITTADVVIINTCVVRESAENRVYGLLNNLSLRRHPGGRNPMSKLAASPQGSSKKEDAIGSPTAVGGLQHDKSRIVLTGCLVGMATRDSSGKMMARLKEKFPMVDEFLHIEEVGFDPPLRGETSTAIVPISNGCNNCCTYCVVPFTRGREVSRPYDDIINECKSLKDKKFKNILLVGQNVNSYGADLNSKLKPVYVLHMGRKRIPTLFPHLLDEIAKMGFEKVDFISSNPWDFSDELIEVIKNNKNITRDIHLPVQSGDTQILKRMNRWYSREDYLKLIKNLKLKIKNLRLSTDLIVGFPGETEEQFNNTVDLCKKVGFYKAYISEYSDRQIAAAHKIFKDDVLPKEKKRRWLILENLINKKT